MPTRRGDWWYYARTFEGKQYGVHCRCPVSDPDDWSPPVSTRTPRSPANRCCSTTTSRPKATISSRWAPRRVSLDGTLLAYSVDVVGDERYTLRFKDLRTGELYPDEIAGDRRGRHLGRRQPHACTT